MNSGEAADEIVQFVTGGLGGSRSERLEQTPNRPVVGGLGEVETGQALGVESCRCARQRACSETRNSSNQRVAFGEAGDSCDYTCDNRDDPDRKVNESMSFAEADGMITSFSGFGAVATSQPAETAVTRTFRI